MKRAFLGPIAQPNRTRRYLFLLLVLICSVITQIGGLFIWPFLSMDPNNIGWRYRFKRWIYPILSYLIGTQVITPMLAPLWGMSALPCSSRDHLTAQSIRTCLFNRNYLKTDAYQTMSAIEQNMERIFPRAPLLYLDAGFPIPYVHMLPHLNHAKGDSIDLAFIWKNPKTEAYALPPSPIGYGGFIEPQKIRSCHPNDTYFIAGRLALVLRWDYEWIQPFVSNATLDKGKSKTLMGLLDKQSMVQSITLEPHLHSVLATSKTISNSCKIARHDDHIHVTFAQNP